MSGGLPFYSLNSDEKERQSIRERVVKNPQNSVCLPKKTPIGEFEALYKIVLIGDSNTGKTSLLLRFSENMFSENYLCTIGVDFKTRTLKIDG